MDTMLLNPQTWDLLLTSNGDIAKASDPYAKAQDVASACKLFNGELWYNTDKGIHYFEQILGYRPPLSLLKKEFEQAALSVPDVVQANAQFDILGGDRILNGRINFIDSEGQANNIKL